eukprot:TRINITY_DN52137_c0_g1_i1.p1 TRINITY_DN52137_c0_g1~~TRINITY_DN52137_c0_g1_i1.p1  ORF type:complete len:396 (+),score=180.97 TRINITY_DN52137_c0_g1_i1:79-1188(+)
MAPQGDTGSVVRSSGVLATLGELEGGWGSEAEKGAHELRDAELQRELLRARGEARALRRQLAEGGAAHKAELAAALNELRRKQREEDARALAELREVKSERCRLEQECDLLRLQLSDTQREASEARADAAAAEERAARAAAAAVSAAGDDAGPPPDPSAAEARRERERARELQLELAALRGRVAAIDRQGLRAQTAEAEALREEAQALREERDAALAELSELRGLAASCERLKGPRIAQLEAELAAARAAASQAEAQQQGAADAGRVAELEAKVCALQDVVRELKDAPRRPLGAGVLEREETELELRKARDDRRNALRLVHQMHQELQAAQRQQARDDRAARGGCRWEAAVARLVEAAERPARQHYGVP